MTPASVARKRTIDITTTGRRSGQPHRIGIWFYLDHGVRADLAARATPVTDERERRRVFRTFVNDLSQPSNPGRVP